MKYSEVVTTNASGQYVFNLNSIYDPNSTGVGHQPYSYDTLSQLYNRYRVISASYRVHTTLISSSGQNSVVTCFPANEIVAFTTGSEARENPRCKYIIQAPGGGNVVCSGKVNIPSLVGRNKAQYMADDRYQATMGSSPSELAVLNIGLYNGATDAPSSQPITVTITYLVEFFDIKHLAQS